MNKRIEEIKKECQLRRKYLSRKWNREESDNLNKMEYLLRIAEMAIMTRNMLKACIGRPVDDTATIFLDKALEFKND